MLLELDLGNDRRVKEESEEMDIIYLRREY